MINKLKNLLFREELAIRQRLLNLILSVALIGGGISMIATLLMGSLSSTLTVAGILVVVLLSLYLSVFKNKVNLAGGLVVGMSNIVIFPLMYFTSGGMYSGMPIWFVMGLIFTWLTMKGAPCFIMYGINLVAMLGCIIFGTLHPDWFLEMPEGYMMSDILQSIVIVSCIIGIIFKYQTHVYEMQQQRTLEKEEQLHIANEAKSQFLANMSHEIRTPINGIIGMDTMLLRDLDEGNTEQIREYAKNIQSASQTLLSLINDILDISKIESGRMELLCVEYNLFSVLNDCYNMNLARIGDKDLRFETDIEESLPSTLYGDEVHIRQIMNNIISNAIKYTREGKVLMRMCEEKRTKENITLRIEVKDTGIGIREEDLGKLFDNFTRLDETKNRNIEGTGLGLSLTKQLVDLMDGEISVRSEYGIGSVFTVLISQRIVSNEPIGNFEEKYRRFIRQEEKEQEFNFIAPKAEILLVDDVEMNLEVAKGLLKSTRARIDTAISGAECLQMVKSKKYHIIFLDHMMPDLDGLETLRLMRRNTDHLNRSTPIIALTANAVVGAKEMYLREGFVDYLSKPIQERELLGMLYRYLPKELFETDKKKDRGLGQFTERNPHPGDPFANTQEASAESISLPERFPYLDISMGLSYCMNSEEFLLKMIREFVKWDKLADMEEQYRDHSWKQYATLIHALKSSAANIGAGELSEQAKALETAAKANDIAYVDAHHGEVMKEYATLQENLKKALPR
ncbi:MAG: response regulator [Lachnospiraceae bacterium]|nr:response regulator [Lachnospiraceae bacterium]